VSDFTTLEMNRPQTDLALQSIQQISGRFIV
jgi:hypothetical protein